MFCHVRVGRGEHVSGKQSEQKGSRPGRRTKWTSAPISRSIHRSCSGVGFGSVANFDANIIAIGDAIVDANIMANGDAIYLYRCDIIVKFTVSFS